MKIRQKKVYITDVKITEFKNTHKLSSLKQVTKPRDRSFWEMLIKLNKLDLETLTSKYKTTATDCIIRSYIEYKNKYPEYKHIPPIVCDMYNTTQELHALISYMRDWLENAIRDNNKLKSHHLAKQNNKAPVLPTPKIILSPQQVWIAHINKIPRVTQYLKCVKNKHIL